MEQRPPTKPDPSPKKALLNTGVAVSGWLCYNYSKQVIMTKLELTIMKSINVGEAKGRFSELISRAAAGERFLIRRRNRPVAALIGAEDLEQMEKSAETARQLALSLGQSKELLDKIDRGESHPAMIAFGLWKDESDLDDLELEIYEVRQSQGSRPDPWTEESP